MAEGTYRVQCVATRTSGVDEDVAVIDLGFYHAAGYTRSEFALLGPIDEDLPGVGALSSGDKTNMLDDLEAFIDDIRGTSAGNLTWDRIKVYRTDNARPTPNSPDFERDINLDGGGTNCLPPQAAISVSLATGSRRHWGRFYVPSIDRGAATSLGLIGSATCDALAAAYATLCVNLGAIEVYPVVYNKSFENASANSVYKVQVDNIFDVIRRRRYDAASYRAVVDFR